MKRCNYCDREFDPSLEFVEDSDMMEALLQITKDKAQDTCPDCCYSLLRDIRIMVGEFYDNPPY